MTLLDNLDRCLLCNHMRTDQDGEGPVPRDLPAPLLVLTLGRIRLLRQLMEDGVQGRGKPRPYRSSGSIVGTNAGLHPLAGLIGGGWQRILSIGR